MRLFFFAFLDLSTTVVSIRHDASPCRSEVVPEHRYFDSDTKSTLQRTVPAQHFACGLVPPEVLLQEAERHADLRYQSSLPPRPLLAARRSDFRFFRSDRTRAGMSRAAGTLRLRVGASTSTRRNAWTSASEATTTCPQVRACNCSCVCPELVYVPPPNAIRIEQPSLLQVQALLAEHEQKEERSSTEEAARKALTLPCSGPDCSPEGCPPVAPCNCYCACRPKVPLKK